MSSSAVMVIKPATAFCSASSNASFTYWKILSLIISCIIHHTVCDTLWINYLDNKMTASAINTVGLKQSSKEPEHCAPAICIKREAELGKPPCYLLHMGEKSPFLPMQEGD